MVLIGAISSDQLQASKYLTGQYHTPMPGFQKLVSEKAKVGQTLFGAIKSTNPSVQMTYNGQSSFLITAILYTYWLPVKPYFDLLNPPIHQSKWHINMIKEQFRKACNVVCINPMVCVWLVLSRHCNNC